MLTKLDRTLMQVICLHILCNKFIIYNNNKMLSVYFNFHCGQSFLNCYKPLSTFGLMVIFHKSHYASFTAF